MSSLREHAEYFGDDECCCACEGCNRDREWNKAIDASIELLKGVRR